MVLTGTARPGPAGSGQASRSSQSDIDSHGDYDHDAMRPGPSDSESDPLESNSRPAVPGPLAVTRRAFALRVTGPGTVTDTVGCGQPAAWAAGVARPGASKVDWGSGLQAQIAKLRLNM